MKIPKLTFNITFILVILFITLSNISDAQPLKIRWQQCMGGSNEDFIRRMIKVKTGIFLFFSTLSNDGEVSGNHGGRDFWVVKTDTLGNITWSKTYGGSSDENLMDVAAEPDGGFILIGYTNSNDGQVNGQHGMFDYWIIRIDSLGTLIWQKCLGGSYLDAGSSIDLNNNSDLICNGWSNSVDGDVTGNHGGDDFWAVRLDQEGNIRWENSFGSSYPDAGSGIRHTSDGGFILAGAVGNNDDDVQCNSHGGQYDAWLVKVDSAGNKEWQQCYGGSGYDNISFVLPVAVGGYLCVGQTDSNDGQITNNHGASDIWVLKIDSLGNLINQKCFGGSNDENPGFVKQLSDGNFIIVGETFSNDGDVSGNHSEINSSDMWIIKITPDLHLLWQQCFGGDMNESAFTIVEDGPGKYILGGCTNTSDSSGNVTCHRWGSFDYDAWLLYVVDTTIVGIQSSPSIPVVVKTYPDPADQYIIFEIPQSQSSSGYLLTIFNAAGNFIRDVLVPCTEDKFILNTNGIPSGLYLYRLIKNENIYTGKICITH